MRIRLWGFREQDDRQQGMVACHPGSPTFLGIFTNAQAASHSERDDRTYVTRRTKTSFMSYHRGPAFVFNEFLMSVAIIMATPSTPAPPPARSRRRRPRAGLRTP